MALKLVGYPNYTGDENRKRFRAKSLEERRPEIPTTTNNTLELHVSTSLCSVPPELQISILIFQAAHLQSS